MKYIQLTKEQFNELHEEFALFLATQKIDESEWEKIKNENPAVADEELNLFSDLVWEKVLQTTSYLEHFSSDSLNLFKCNAEDIQRVVVKIEKPGIDLLKKEGFNWFLDNSKDESIEYFKGQKPYTKERNLEIFDLIQKGSVISKGDLFNAVFKIISS
jgi:hypothetical protein